MEQESSENEFYVDAAKYWDGIPPTVDGMLGGFGFISKVDIEGSNDFLQSVFKIKDRENLRAVDCGAGIGRITKNLLIKHFPIVDLVEQNPKFLDAAKTYLQDCSSKIGNYYPIGLQHFAPEAETYDVIWCQWVLGHLQDDDLITFFKNCRIGLRENGMIIVKENVTNSDKVEVDTVDSSVTRPRTELRRAFEKAGLVCLRETKQRKMPQGLYPVYMFALVPKNSS